MLNLNFCNCFIAGLAVSIPKAFSFLVTRVLTFYMTVFRKLFLDYVMKVFSYFTQLGSFTFLTQLRCFKLYTQTFCDRYQRARVGIVV